MTVEESDKSNLKISEFFKAEWTLSSSISFRPDRIMNAPKRWNSYARYSPIPEEAPVIQTVLPENEIGLYKRQRHRAMYIKNNVVVTSKNII